MRSAMNVYWCYFVQLFSWTILDTAHIKHCWFMQDGWTPLITASFRGHVDIVRMLIQAKAEVNPQERVCLPPPDNTLDNHHTHFFYISTLTVFLSQDGWTALHMAAQEGKSDVARLLTEAKAHVNKQTEVYTLYHICYKTQRYHFLSDDWVESMYMLCACMYICKSQFCDKCSKGVLLLAQY